MLTHEANQPPTYFNDPRDTALFVFYPASISYNNSGKFSPEDEFTGRGYIVTHIGTEMLGPVYVNHWLRGIIELVGQVPEAFHSKTFSITRTEDISRAYVKNLSGNVVQYTPYNSDSRDDSSNSYDGTPSASNKIYDGDVPGVSLDYPNFINYPNGTIFGFRSNFTQRIKYKANDCAQGRTWHVERTVKKVNNEWVDEGPRNSVGPGPISTDL